MRTTNTTHKLPPSRRLNGEDETRTLAYLLWEQAGCPDGQDVTFWLAAERQIDGKPSTLANSRTTKSPRKNSGKVMRRAKPAAKKKARTH